MSIKLTDTQLVMLSAAAQRNDHCLVAAPNVKAAAAQKIAGKLIASGLVKEIKAKPGAPVWRRDDEAGQFYALKLTAVGAKAIAIDESAEPAHVGDEGNSRENVEQAGALLVREWKGKLERVTVLEKGFAWNGKSYSSLSQIAKAMTGTAWNGHRFFGWRTATSARAARARRGLVRGDRQAGCRVGRTYSKQPGRDRPRFGASLASAGPAGPQVAGRMAADLRFVVRDPASARRGS